MFVPNVTTGLNTAMRAVEDVFKTDDGSFSSRPKVLRTGLTYNSTGFMAERLSELTGAELITAEMEMPIRSEEDAVRRFREVRSKLMLYT